METTKNTPTEHAEPITPPPLPIANPITPTAHPVHPGQPTPNQSNGLAIGSLITGVLALLLSFVPILGLLLGTAAVVLGILALKKIGGRGLSIAGLITGGVGVLINLLFVVLLFIGFSLFSGAVKEAVEQAEQEAANNSTSQTETGADTDKRDFAKGESATINNLKVSFEIVERNYVPQSTYQAAKEGEEIIVVKVNAENVGDKSTGAYVSAFTIIDETLTAENSKRYSYITGLADEFKTKTLAPGESTTGNLAFTIKKDATEPKVVVKLTLTTYGAEAKKENLVYTFAL